MTIDDHNLFKTIPANFIAGGLQEVPHDSFGQCENSRFLKGPLNSSEQEYILELPSCIGRGLYFVIVNTKKLCYKSTITIYQFNWVSNRQSL